MSILVISYKKEGASMEISNHIEQVRERLRRGEFISEAAVSQGILLPTLHELGWPVFDTNVVVPEFSVQGGRVDFALCNPPRRPLIFIEVKRVGISEGADRQLFEYAFHSGVPMAVLTDGQEWSFYLPGEQGRYDERRVYKLDLLEREIEEAVSRLERYLHYEKVCSGEALKSARADYQNVARDREIEATLPRAWESLLEEPDSIVVGIISRKSCRSLWL
ncbi:type I restriction enzyme HsdR N-terminal domain-containing protein [Thermosynechococcus sp. NK55a]|uniref:type I restriction enzyme HsdR N-terminal domain-containing protein n=1 Tax=Thermosynechococcus sp. NK55a TaxID=1394889 RepID=UPI00190FA110|nr:type I restriction enzyme HsdR N-terminal domain-containing protein [Thermosynechococcus sp. NK55a]